jgi:hypothetical protein
MSIKLSTSLLGVGILFIFTLVASAGTRYVDANNAAPAYPYTSWETAAQVIQDAVDAADAGDEVLVTNGVYATGGRAVYGTMTNRVAIDKVVSVRSVNGPNQTFIMGQGIGAGGNENGKGAIRCAYVGPNAVLSGFTLTNGYTQIMFMAYEESCGGGAWCASRGTVNNCTITGNSSDYGGGGAYGGTLRNCILLGNTSACGGAAYSVNAYNCTVIANKGKTSVGGVSLCNLFNCIVYYNTAPVYPNYASCSFYDSCSWPLPRGSSNIDSDPLLASTTHISSNSPCIGRGYIRNCSGSDIDGEGWLNPPCMGADQYIPGGGGEISVAMKVDYTNNIGTGYAVSFVALNNGPVSATVWDFGDGVVTSNRVYISHAWDGPGLYQVRLTGYNDMYPGGVTASVMVEVTDQEVYYVNAANSMPIYPYTTREGASTNIQKAIDAGTQVGRLVLVANGVYSSGGRAVGLMQNRVVVPDSVELRSENGPQMTTIAGQPAPGTTSNGDGAFRCVYLSSNAVLSGFTLSNGHTRTNGDLWQYQSGGGAWCELGGIITNCAFVGNSARVAGGGVYAGILNNCTLLGNNSTTLPGWAGGLGGGAHSCVANNCTFNGNSASYGGGGASASTLNNCTLVGNGAETGGGTDGSVLNNSILYYNSASLDGGNYYGGEFSYCCTVPLPSAGIGNITNAPLFINASGWANLRLQPTSPCINSGNNANAPGTTDLGGSPRLVGGKVDIGAYEYQGSGSAISYAWLQQYGLPVDGSADFIDSDGDGFDNWTEWLCKTDPTNSASILRFSSIQTNIYSYMTLQWKGVNGVNYFLERSTNLSATASFLPLATNISGTSGTMTYYDSTPRSETPVFYRLGVRN